MVKVLNENRLEDLKAGDAIFQTEMVSEKGDMRLVTHKLIFEEYLDKSTKLIDVEIHDDSLLAQLHTEAAPNIKVKTDISCGFFKNEKDAMWEFVNMTQIIYEKARDEFTKKYVDILGKSSQ
jgi:hypothetical protein